MALLSFKYIRFDMKVVYKHTYKYYMKLMFILFKVIYT
jgi:hypothetical protein